MHDWRKSFIKQEKRGRENLEVVYNVKYKFKTNERITDEEIKNIFNNKLLKVIILLEKQALLLKKS